MTTAAAHSKADIPGVICELAQMADDCNLTVHSYNEKPANEITACLADHHTAIAACIDTLKEKMG